MDWSAPLADWHLVVARRQVVDVPAVVGHRHRHPIVSAPSIEPYYERLSASANHWVAQNVMVVYRFELVIFTLLCKPPEGGRERAHRPLGVGAGNGPSVGRSVTSRPRCLVRAPEACTPPADPQLSLAGCRTRTRADRYGSPLPGHRLSLALLTF